MAGVLCVWKSFLGPIYRWAKGCPLGGFIEVPTAILAFFAFLLHEVESAPTEIVVSDRMVAGELFRADASARKDEVVLGGWQLAAGEDTMQAPWVAIRLSRAAAPWTFEKAGEPHRVVAALELMAGYAALRDVLVAAVSRPPGGRTQCLHGGV